MQKRLFISDIIILKWEVHFTSTEPAAISLKAANHLMFDIGNMFDIAPNAQQMKYFATLTKRPD